MSNLSNKNLKIELVRIYQKAFKDRNIQMQVLTSDPRVEREIPCLAINRLSDSEDIVTMANLEDVEFADGEENNVYSALMSETIELRLWTQNANERDSLYTTIKEIAILAKVELGTMGCGNMRITAGRDENDFNNFSPLFIYWATINFVAMNQMFVRPLTSDDVGTINEIIVKETVDSSSGSPTPTESATPLP